jgi:hypothetical protein
MSRTQLVAETPRAGKWNHRFIVSSTGDLSDSEVAKVVAAARRNLQGEDYLAVSVKTAQSVSGRTGDEILVLTGIEVNKLSGTQRQQIMAQLEQRLAELAVLVTEKIDWERAGQSLLVERAELAEWEKAISNLLRVKRAIPPVKKPPAARKWHPSQLKLAGGVIGVLLVLGLGIWIGNGLGSTSCDCPTNPPPSSSQKPGENVANSQCPNETEKPLEATEIGSLVNEPWCLLPMVELPTANPDFSVSSPKDTSNKPAVAEQPKSDNQKTNLGSGTTTQDSPVKISGNSLMKSTTSSVVKSSIFSSSQGSNQKLPDELQKHYDELKHKVVACDKNALSLVTNEKQEYTSFVCKVLEKVKNSNEVGDFIASKPPVPSNWCQESSENRKRVFNSLEKNNVIKTDAVGPALDFIKQLCPTT